MKMSMPSRMARHFLKILSSVICYSLCAKATTRASRAAYWVCRLLYLCSQEFFTASVGELNAGEVSLSEDIVGVVETSSMNLRSSRISVSFDMRLWKKVKMPNDAVK